MATEIIVWRAYRIGPRIGWEDLFGDRDASTFATEAAANSAVDEWLEGNDLGRGEDIEIEARFA